MRLSFTNATPIERKEMSPRPSRITSSLTVFATTALLTSGCISTERTEYREVERVKVEFESDAAGRAFYEGLAKLQSRRNRTESKTDISIPVVFEHRHRVVEGENVAFNEAVHKCDTNGDGKITETEARIFAEHMAKP
jgi:hypothetical protein